jgi:glycosyltransferase involved in cell wall biosynthesis
MRVALFPSDDSGCGWYRLLFAGHELMKQGHDIVVNPPEMGFYRDPDGGPSRLFLDADVAVVQRTVRDTAVAFVQSLKDHGHRVIVDVDDDLDALHDGHPYIGTLNSEGRAPQNLHAVCELADLVTATTQPLLDRYARHGRGVVLPNLIPANYLHMKPRRKGKPRVGWTGRPISHIGDTSVLGNAVAKAVVEHDAMFAAWGQSSERAFQELRIPTGRRVVVPARPLRSGFPSSVAELSVGLVPLLDTPFNRAKSWLKGIESASLGVPFVASPLPEYVKLHEMGAGLLADSPQEWYDALSLMLAEPEYRDALAARGREAVQGLTYEAHAGRWWDAWTGSDASATVRGPGATVPLPA